MGAVESPAESYSPVIRYCCVNTQLKPGGEGRIGPFGEPVSKPSQCLPWSRSELDSECRFTLWALCSSALCLPIQS